MLNVGILGCGKMGRLDAEIFSKNNYCEVTGLYNRTKEKAVELQKNYPHAKVYDKWQDMVSDSNIDIIVVSTPQTERKDQYNMAMKHGKHVYIETAMSLGVNDLKETLDSLKNSDSIFYVDSQIRSHPVIRAVNEELDKIGKIIHIEMQYFMYRPDEMKWKHKLTAGGGALRELGGLMIDQACVWLGKPKSVTSNNRIINHEREVEDFSVNLIEFESGATLLLTNNFYTQNGPLYRGRIVGKKGQIDFTFSSYDIAHSKATLYINEKETPLKFDIPDKDNINSIYPGFMDSFKKEIDMFVDCVLNNEKAEDTLTKEWYKQQVTSAAYVSSRTDNKVSLPLESFDVEILSESFRKF